MASHQHFQRHVYLFHKNIALYMTQFWFVFLQLCFFRTLIMELWALTLAHNVLLQCSRRL